MLTYLYAAKYIEKNAWLCIMVEVGMLWKRQSENEGKETITPDTTYYNPPPHQTEPSLKHWCDCRPYAVNTYLTLLWATLHWAGTNTTLAQPSQLCE